MAENINSMKNLLRQEWVRMVTGLVNIPEGQQMLSLPLKDGAYPRQHGKPVPVDQLRQAAVSKGYVTLVDGNTIRFARPAKQAA